MYQETNFDQSSLQGGGLLQADDGFSQTYVPNCDNNQRFSVDDQSSYPIYQQEAAAAALEMEFQHHLEIEQCYSNKNGGEIQEGIDNWLSNFCQFQNQIYATNGSFNPTPPDLLNMFPLPRCSAQKNPSFLSSLGLLGEINPSGSVVYDPLLPLNLPPQPPLLRELFHSLPHGSLFDERENGGLYQNGDGMGRSNFENGVFEFNSADMDCGGKNRDGKDVKHFATERHRRVLLNDKYQALRRLVPSPTKNDRASIVGDAIEYILELKRTVSELKLVVEKKRCAKRPKTGSESKGVDDLEHPGSTFRSSWLLRKSKNTEVDVRIIDDEVTLKLVQQKRINCLLFVSKVLDELHLDLHHVAGGLIGDYYTYLFNSKISQGSSVYASALANKLIQVVDAAIASTSS